MSTDQIEKEEETKTAPDEDVSSEEEYVWYLAYGSNLHPKVLEGRRKVYPKESLGCKIPSYKLVFTCMGIPYLEPCCASIAPFNKEEENSMIVECDDDRTHLEQCLHGVAHYITAEEFKMILRTEGGGGYENLGYDVVKLNVTTYSGKEIECVTLLWDVSVNLKHQQKISLNEAQPSKRYLTLLVEGAEHHNLDSKYQNWLKEIPYYSGPQTISQRFGKMVTIFVGGMLGIPILLALKLYKSVDVYPPKWIYALSRSVFNCLNYFHDYFLKWVFGNGTVGMNNGPASRKE